ncbi:hypothetical protein K0M31_015473, partial [Melipona bicolor]
MAARRAQSVINNLELIKVSDKSMETVIHPGDVDGLVEDFVQRQLKQIAIRDTICFPRDAKIFLPARRSRSDRLTGLCQLLIKSNPDDTRNIEKMER